MEGERFCRKCKGDYLRSMRAKHPVAAQARACRAFDPLVPEGHTKAWTWYNGEMDRYKDRD